MLKLLEIVKILHIDKDKSYITPSIVFIPNEIIQSNDLKNWLDAIAQYKKPTIICVENFSFHKKYPWK